MLAIGQDTRVDTFDEGPSAPESQLEMVEKLLQHVARALLLRKCLSPTLTAAHCLSSDQQSERGLRPTGNGRK